MVLNLKRHLFWVYFDGCHAGSYLDTVSLQQPNQRLFSISEADPQTLLNPLAGLTGEQVDQVCQSRL